MVVVERKNETEVQEIRYASAQADFTGNATNVFVESTSLTTLDVLATARKRPCVIRHLAADCETKATFTIGLCGFLMDTIGSALKARLRKREATGQERHCNYFFHLFSLLLVNISCDSHSSRSYHSRTPHDARTC